MRNDSYIPCIDKVTVNQHVATRVPPVFQVGLHRGREHYPRANHVCEWVMARHKNPSVISYVFPLMMDIGQQCPKYVSLRRTANLLDGCRERDALVEQRFESITHVPRPRELGWPPEGGRLFKTDRFPPVLRQPP